MRLAKLRCGPFSLRRVISTGPEPEAISEPKAVSELEMSGLTVSTFSDSIIRWSTNYTEARILIRFHGWPLGFFSFDFHKTAVLFDDFVTMVWSRWGDEIALHCDLDGLIVEAGVTSFGDIEANCVTRQQHRFTPFASVVICTMGRPRQLEMALDALLSMSYKEFEVLVIDNDPATTSTRELVERRFSSDTRLRYVAEAKRGLSFARNRGLSEARGSVVAFTDDDIVVDQWWLASLVAGFEGDESVSCVTGLTVAAELDTTAQLMFEGYGAFNGGYRARLFTLHENPAGTKLYPYTAGVFGGGGNSAFNIQRIGQPLRFDTRLGPGTASYGAEDLDAFFAVIRRGQSIRYVPDAIAWHAHRRDYSEVRWQLFTYGVGFSAFLTKWILTDPRILVDLVRMAFTSLLRPGAPRHEDEGGSHLLPRHLRRLERLGYLYGPWAYLRSWAAASRGR